MFSNIEKAIEGLVRSVESNRKEQASVVARIKRWADEKHPNSHGLDKHATELRRLEFLMFGYFQRIAALKCLRAELVKVEN